MRETLPKMDFEAPIMSYSAVSATAMNAGPAKADPSSQLDSLANPSAPGTESEGKKLMKATKARDIRHRQTCVHQWQPDLLQFYVGIRNGSQQSPGNSVRSGLTWTNGFISESALVLVANFLQKEYRKAASQRALNPWQWKLQQIF